MGWRAVCIEAEIKIRHRIVAIISSRSLLTTKFSKDQRTPPCQTAVSISFLIGVGIYGRVILNIRNHLKWVGVDIG